MVKLHCGDLIVMGSDGLFDNLTSGEVTHEVSAYFNENGVAATKHESALWERQCILSQLAERLLHSAYLHSKDTNYHSPFSMRWNRRLAVTHGSERRWHGGKEDDIAVVVAEAYC
eukprot:TRINITY_DN4849_c0_g1_i2.p1 TRINITY_DN4849_c0_g1~~TRINITY_DN4849_c0_g1_i2.p1  ORF type:complete len:115 (-),score=34.67 TRINITY_DN4849_c0_g1_i2:208-552(-)